MAGKDVREVVRDGYAKIAVKSAPGAGCCGPQTTCGGDVGAGADAFAKALGYAPEDLAALPEGTNLALSCGNPAAIASLREGEVVVDLGSGAGFDVLIVARKVGPEGRVIGVDMTPEMISRARANAAKVGAANVEFRLGEIENLPVADATADVVISNCVINLSPEKERVFREIARVLRPGGRLAVSDLALLRPLPEAVRADLEAYVGCVAGAVLIEEYEKHVRDAGLADVSITVKESIALKDEVQDPLYRTVRDKLPAGTHPSQYVASIDVRAVKPPAPSSSR